MTPLTVNTQTLIKQDLVRHEGYKEEVYLDSLGILTSGIGHKEEGKVVGQRVSRQYVMLNFERDFNLAVSVADKAIDLEQHPTNVQRVAVNMAFNLGSTGFRRFDRMIKAIRSKDYDKAASEMVDSVWYNQVGTRSRYLVQLMRNK